MRVCIMSRALVGYLTELIETWRKEHLLLLITKCPDSTARVSRKMRMIWLGNDLTT